MVSQGEEPPMSIKARQVEDEPDYLKELLAQAGIVRAGFQCRRQATGGRHW